MEVICPYCEKGMSVRNFSFEEKEGKVGRNIICPHCDASFWLSPKGEPVFFPLSTNQSGQLRLRILRVDPRIL